MNSQYLSLVSSFPKWYVVLFFYIYIANDTLMDELMNMENMSDFCLEILLWLILILNHIDKFTYKWHICISYQVISKANVDSGRVIGRVT